MGKIMICVVLVVSMSVAVVQVSEAGAVAYQHRDTTLEDLKSIDRYVATGLPVLQDGFFISTSRGPVLVKSNPPPGTANDRPVVRQKYYNTLPRLIPVGFEGIATSHFNLGAASRIQPYSFSKQDLTAPAAQSSQYINRQSPTEQYAPQPVAFEQSQQLYDTQTQSSPQQYVAESQQPQQQYVAEAQQPQYIAQSQPLQAAHYEPQQQFIQGASQPQSQQFAHIQQSQQYFQTPSQYISDQPDPQQVPQERAHISERSHYQSAPLAQSSFQVDNLLKPEQDQPLSTAFQTQTFGAERFQSQRLVPNNAVVRTSEFEETLPETLRNRFYKNANLATILAQESLPIQGEEIIHQWDTNKIAKSKIRSLLHGAGLI